MVWDKCGVMGCQTEHKKVQIPHEVALARKVTSMVCLKFELFLCPPASPDFPIEDVEYLIVPVIDEYGDKWFCIKAYYVGEAPEEFALRESEFNDFLREKIEEGFLLEVPPVLNLQEGDDD